MFKLIFDHIVFTCLSKIALAVALWFHSHGKRGSKMLRLVREQSLGS